jgi:ribonuclease P/MRP protein subunit RPP25
LIVVKGMGRAINKTVTVAEIVKRRVAGLHQDTEIASLESTDTWEPHEEGGGTIMYPARGVRSLGCV